MRIGVFAVLFGDKPFEDALHVQRVLEAVEQSAKSGVWADVH